MTASRRRRSRSSLAVTGRSGSAGPAVRPLSVPSVATGGEPDLAVARSGRSMVVISSPSGATIRAMWRWSSSKKARISSSPESGPCVLGCVTIASATRCPTAVAAVTGLFLPNEPG